MAFNRREFVRKLGGLAGATALTNLMSPVMARNMEQAMARVAHLSPEAVASDEEFWYQIRQAYTVSPSLINLNNGGVSPQPKVVQDAMDRYNRYGNEGPTFYMWQTMRRERMGIRRNLAMVAGCLPEEVAIVRNTTEALGNIIFGLRLQRGDEVIVCRQDYPNMINAWKQREMRDGIVLKWLSFDFPIEDEDQIANTFINAFTEKTRLVQVTHMVNWVGQIMPVAKIAKAAKARGIEVMVDAAHSFGQLDFKIPDLNCDYLGTSLHKWLCAPFGTGLLYVKKDKIKSLYPLLSAPDPEDDKIQKFENLGTRSVPIEQAIGPAIIFHETVGIQRKQARLHYLKAYWASRAADIPNVHIHTSLDPRFSGAIGLFSIPGKNNIELARALYHGYRIHAVAIDWENISGIRISPNIYTLKRELDVLLQALTDLAKP
ncbi:MAG: aminotransferase class V-fold PLP-dependent enzyme [Bacteroidota bacterium]